MGKDGNILKIQSMYKIITELVKNENDTDNLKYYSVKKKFLKKSEMFSFPNYRFPYLDNSLIRFSKVNWEQSSPLGSQLGFASACAVGSFTAG